MCMKCQNCLLTLIDNGGLLTYYLKYNDELLGTIWVMQFLAFNTKKITRQ